MADHSEVKKPDVPIKNSINQYSGKFEKSSLDKPIEKEKPKNEVIANAERRKTPIGTKMKDLFIGDDVSDIKRYILEDVVVPTIEDTIYSIVTGSLDRLFRHDGRITGTNSRKKGSYIAYNSIYNSSYSRGNRESSSRRTPDDALFESKADADAALAHLFDIAESEYEYARIADLYESAGITASWADNNFGWNREMLSNATVRNTRGQDGSIRYFIKLPAAVKI